MSSNKIFQGYVFGNVLYTPKQFLHLYKYSDASIKKDIKSVINLGYGFDAWLNNLNYDIKELN